MEISGASRFNSRSYDDCLVQRHEDDCSDSDASANSNLSLSEMINSEVQDSQTTRRAKPKPAKEVTEILERTLYRLIKKVARFIDATEDVIVDNCLAICDQNLIEMAILTDNTRSDLLTCAKDFQRIIEEHQNSIAVKSTTTVATQTSTASSQNSNTRKSPDLSKKSNKQKTSQGAKIKKLPKISRIPKAAKPPMKCKKNNTRKASVKNHMNIRTASEEFPGLGETVGRENLNNSKTSRRSDEVIKTANKNCQQNVTAPCGTPNSRKRSLYSPAYWTPPIETAYNSSTEEPSRQKLKVFA